MRGRGVSIHRGKKLILDRIDFDVQAGEFLCIVGPNGAGKSTLLAAISRDIPISDGEISLFGSSLSDHSIQELARLRGILPQQHRVAFGFSAREVIEMGCSPHQQSRPDLIDTAVRELDLEGLLDRPFRALSGGEQARVAFARVLVQDTPLLMLDEPTAALDLRHQGLIMRIAKKRSQLGFAVVAVVHDLNLAAEFADRIVLVADKSILASGPPGSVLQPDLLSSAYRTEIGVVAHPKKDHLLVFS